MDQDFHYYGTYYAARTTGYEGASAARIARAANFIDFMHEGDYGHRWDLVATAESANEEGWDHVATIEHPRLTFQNSPLSVGVFPEDGLWCSFHFTPGNYDHVSAPSAESVHGTAAASRLPGFETRTIANNIRASEGLLLNRPQSALSTSLIADTLNCLADDDRIEAIFAQSVGGAWLLANNQADHVARFRQLLLGVRAHVIADTWAHQDWSGVNSDTNTYYDIADEFGREAIEYQDLGDTWHHKVLSVFEHENLQAVPNGTSHLGHGWMGHFPDYSFARYRYRPRWKSKQATPQVRDNPSEYQHAFLELCSLFAQSRGELFDPASHATALALAEDAIGAPCEIADTEVCPRAESSDHWLRVFGPAYGHTADEDTIDASQEPHPNARLSGLLATPSWLASASPWSTITVEISSDLALFQIAADYHFHFVKHFLGEHQIRDFHGRWSQQPGPLGEHPELF